jgi:O-succinylbenzoate synthase
VEDHGRAEPRAEGLGDALDALARLEIGRAVAVETVLVSLELREPLEAADARRVARPVLYVRVLTASGEGWGECGALAEGGQGGEPLAVAMKAVEQRLAPKLLALAGQARGSRCSVGSLAAGLRATERCRFALAAIEMALVDAALRTAGRSLASLLGVRADAVEAGAVVGIDPDPERLVARVGALVDRGVQRVKLKVSPGVGTRGLESVRAHFPNLMLLADANASWSGHDPRALETLDALGLACLEQPFRPGELELHARLAERLATPVALDETLVSTRVLEHAAGLGACEVACLKPARTGLLGALRFAARARALGIGLFVGGLLETALARLANASIAALEACTLPGDLVLGPRFVEGDPTGYEPPLTGRVRLWQEPGVGPPPVDLAGRARGRWRVRANDQA